MREAASANLLLFLSSLQDRTIPFHSESMDAVSRPSGAASVLDQAERASAWPSLRLKPLRQLMHTICMQGARQDIGKTLSPSNALTRAKQHGGHAGCLASWSTAIKRLTFLLVLMPRLWLSCFRFLVSSPSQLNVLVTMSQGSANKIALQLWLGGLPRPSQEVSREMHRLVDLRLSVTHGVPRRRAAYALPCPVPTHAHE